MVQNDKFSASLPFYAAEQKAYNFNVSLSGDTAMYTMNLR